MLVKKPFVLLLFLMSSFFWTHFPVTYPMSTAPSNLSPSQCCELRSKLNTFNQKLKRFDFFFDLLLKLFFICEYVILMYEKRFFVSKTLFYTSQKRHGHCLCLKLAMKRIPFYVGEHQLCCLWLGEWMSTSGTEKQVKRFFFLTEKITWLNYFFTAHTTT